MSEKEERKKYVKYIRLWTCLHSKQLMFHWQHYKQHIFRRDHQHHYAFMLKHWVQCFHAKTYVFMLRVLLKHIRRSTLCSGSAFPLLLFSSLYNVAALSIVGWKIFFPVVVYVSYTTAKNEVGEKTRTASWLFEIWFERVPACFLCSIQFVQIFSPLCCCSRVCPVEFFNFSFNLRKKNRIFYLFSVASEKRKKKRKPTYLTLNSVKAKEI